jgi:hypothetical protein
MWSHSDRSYDGTAGHCSNRLQGAHYYAPLLLCSFIAVCLMVLIMDATCACKIGSDKDLGTKRRVENMRLSGYVDNGEFLNAK